MSVAGILTFLSESKIAKATIIIFLIIVAFGTFAITVAVKNKAISEKKRNFKNISKSWKTSNL